MSLEIGDVIIDGDGAGGTHAMLWVGELGKDKPLIHSSNEKWIGVFQQSMSYIGKRILDEQFVPSGCGVYRYNGPVKGLGEKACEFALKWATQPGNVTKLQPTVPDDQQSVLRTPFSPRRLGAAEARRKTGGSAVTVETIFRVLKSIARTESQSTLSPNHGVSCSQFVVYCYQAAALSLQIGATLPPELVNQLKAESPKATSPDEKVRMSAYVKDEWDEDATKRRYWREKTWWAEQGVFRAAKRMKDDKGAVSLLEKVLKHNGKEDFYKSVLPVGMNIDPKSYGVVYLTEQLRDKDSHFPRVGQLLGKVTQWSQSKGPTPSAPLNPSQPATPAAPPALATGAPPPPPPPPLISSPVVKPASQVPPGQVPTQWAWEIRNV
jgi:hypothetical protein